MFGFLKRLFHFDDGVGTNTLDDYLNMVVEKSKTNSCERFATFTPEGFNLIMELLIDKTQYSLCMFIEKRELFFDSFKMTLLEAKLKQLESNGGKITIITFGGEKDHVFMELQEKYPNCFEYYALKCTNAPKVNNFVVVNNKSYLLEDTCLHRSTIHDVLKAEVNFFDFSRTSELMEEFNSYVEIGRGN